MVIGVHFKKYKLENYRQISILITIFVIGTVLRMCFSYFAWVSVNAFCRTAMPAPGINKRKLDDALSLKSEGQQLKTPTPVAAREARMCIRRVSMVSLCERVLLGIKDCRTNGVQGSNTDLLICAVAINHQLPVFML